jgi:hypothetical protein
MKQQKPVAEPHEDQGDNRVADRQPANGSAADPFLDADVGPQLWTEIAPTGKRYWPFVLLLAIGLSVFSHYWRNHWVPEQPLVWRVASDIQLRQSLAGGNPVLVWYAPIREQDKVAPAATANQAPSADLALATAIAGLDVPLVRRALRLHSVELWRVESPPSSELEIELSRDGQLPTPALILWHADPAKSRNLTEDEISIPTIMNWIEATRRTYGH